MKRAFHWMALGWLLSGAAGATVVVQSGDTLWRISQRHGLTVAQLQQLNGLEGTHLAVGQTLRVSANAPSPEASPAPAPGAPTTTATDKVRPPARVRMGDAFVMEVPAGVQIRFPSELNEDVRRPNEVLSPLSIGGRSVVLGRVVLGQTAPVRWETVGREAPASGLVSVSPLGQSVQTLNLPASTAAVLRDPGRAAEEATMERIYALRSEPLWTKTFAFPVAPNTRQSSGFGRPRRERAGSKVSYHYGVDFAAPMGTRVNAVNDGRVVVAARYPVRGGTVAIDHGGGLISLYFHLSKQSVSVGQTVARGQKIGEIGTTGYSTGPHLHLEMRLRGEAVSPLPWMNKLLPE